LAFNKAKDNFKIMEKLTEGIKVVGGVESWLADIKA